MIARPLIAISIAAALVGCKNKTDEIREKAQADETDHERRAKEKFAQIEKRFRGDLTKIMSALRDLPYAKGTDFRQHEKVVAARAIVDELGTALESRCIAADIIGLDTSDKEEPGHVGLNVVPKGSVEIRDCEQEIRYECFEKPFKIDTTTVNSCNIEVGPTKGVSKPGFMVYVYEDMAYATLRLAITL